MHLFWKKMDRIIIATPCTRWFYLRRGWVCKEERKGLCGDRNEWMLLFTSNSSNSILYQTPVSHHWLWPKQFPTTFPQIPFFLKSIIKVSTLWNFSSNPSHNRAHGSWTKWSIYRLIIPTNEALVCGDGCRLRSTRVFYSFSLLDFGPSFVLAFAFSLFIYLFISLQRTKQAEHNGCGNEGMQGCHFF